MNPALGCLRPRDLTGAMAGLVALAVVGFGIGLIASGTDIYDRYVPGLAAMTYALPFAASTVINLALWGSRPRKTPVTRTLAIAVAVVALGAVGWIAGIYAPDPLVGPLGWGSGFVVAIGSMVVCDAVLAARRSAGVPASDRRVAAITWWREHRSDVIVLIVVVLALGAGLVAASLGSD